MESVLYEDISDISLRLERLKLAFLSFIAIRPTAPSVVGLLVPVSLSNKNKNNNNKIKQKEKEEEEEVKLHCASLDRVELRRWLRCEFNIIIEIYVIAAMKPNNNSELTLLSNWQNNRHNSPLRQADLILLSLEEIAFEWGELEQRKPPMLNKFLLPHQSLLLDFTCCIGEGSKNNNRNNRQIINPAIFNPLRVKHLAKGRTSAVIFYKYWISLTSTTSGLVKLQKQFRAFAREIISPMQLPFFCSYGGEIESLQHNRITIPSSLPYVINKNIINQDSSSEISAALIETRSLKDILSLVSILFGHPQVNYYTEAMNFCASVQRRCRAGNLVYRVNINSENIKLPIKTKEENKVVVTKTLLNIRHRKRKRQKEEDNEKKKNDNNKEEEEELLWCEDVGK